jgi:hypothetical protein
MHGATIKIILNYYFETHISRLSKQEFFSFKIMGFDTNYIQKTAI